MKDKDLIEEDLKKETVITSEEEATYDTCNLKDVEDKVVEEVERKEEKMKETKKNLIEDLDEIKATGMKFFDTIKKSSIKTVDKIKTNKELEDKRRSLADRILRRQTALGITITTNEFTEEELVEYVKEEKQEIERLQVKLKEVIKEIELLNKLP